MENKILWGKYIACWILTIATILMGVAVCFGVTIYPPTTTRGVFLVGITTGIIFTCAYFLAWSLLAPLIKKIWCIYRHKQYSIIKALGSKG